MNKEILEKTARELVAPGKGILAADESSGTIKKRFDTIGVESTEESRRAYREILFTAEAVEKHISGVILFDETIRQSTSDGVPFAKVLASRGIVPGIKVDKGAKDMAGFQGEKVTEGLDGLRERLEEYQNLGARFAKWRAVVTIGDAIPSSACLRANGHALARYAALCQEADVVPIVEPEVLMDGAHTIEQCEEVTLATLDTVFDELREQRVHVAGALLKPNMVISGKACPTQAGVTEVAEATVRCFRSVLPKELPGVVFLSGGQTPRQATEHLNAMNAMGEHPWELSFSYGRALQEPVLAVWQGKAGNAGSAKRALELRAMLNGAARYGKYSSDMEAGA